MKHAAPRPGEQHLDPAGGPLRRQRLPYLLIVAGLVACLAWIASAQRHVRSGTLALAAVLLLAAAVRALLPGHRAGMLGARRRLADVATLGALGAALLVVGLEFAPLP